MGHRRASPSPLPPLPFWSKHPYNPKPNGRNYEGREMLLSATPATEAGVGLLLQSEQAPVRHFQAKIWGCRTHSPTSIVSGSIGKRKETVEEEWRQRRMAVAAESPAPAMKRRRSRQWRRLRCRPQWLQLGRGSVNRWWSHWQWWPQPQWSSRLWSCFCLRSCKLRIMRGSWLLFTKAEASGPHVSSKQWFWIPKFTWNLA